MTLSGKPHAYILSRFLTYSICCVRTLATDRGFKERVREDMLVRLLDAFVWRNHGMQQSP